MISDLRYDTASLESFCHRWKISELSFFGSVLRNDFRPDSDVDVLVEFLPTNTWDLLDLAAMEHELAQILGRSVDIVTRNSLKQSRNQIFRNHVLANVRPIFVA
jgi:predicted nucleotidyltransferase